MGGAAAAAVGAAAARARRQVMSHFLSQNAVAPDKAVSFTADNHMEQRFFDRLRDRGVILPGTSDGYYVDAPAYDAYLQEQRRMARRALIVVLAVAVIGVAVTLILIHVTDPG